MMIAGRDYLPTQGYRRYGAPKRELGSNLPDKQDGKHLFSIAAGEAIAPQRLNHWGTIK